MTKELEAVTLRPCPFCGGPPEWLTERTFQCNNGDCLIVGTRLRDAEAWNRRAQSPDKQDREAEEKLYAQMGRKVRMLLNGGTFDLRDSPKSLISTCDRWISEIDSALAQPDATPTGDTNV